MSETVQFKIPQSDTIMVELIQKLNKEYDKKGKPWGYVAKQLRARLEVYERIAKLFEGEHDPQEIYGMVKSMYDAKQAQQPAFIQHINEETQKPKVNDITNSVLNIAKQIGNV